MQQVDSEFNGYGTFSRNGIIVIGLSYMLSELVQEQQRLSYSLKEINNRSLSLDHTAIGTG